MNSSDDFSDSSRSYVWQLHDTLLIAYDIVEYLIIPFGILLNLWVLIAVLTCKDIRSRMRNKVVCSFCLMHLLNSLVFQPMQVDAKRVYGCYRRFNCHYMLALHHMSLMQDFMANWTLVLLVVIFVSQVCDYKPHAGFTKLATVVGTYTVLALPWVGSLITIPVTTTLTHYSFLKEYNISDYEGCIIITIDSLRIIWWLDTTVPLLIAGVLLVTALVLRRRRFTRGFSSGTQVELTNQGPEIDQHYGYTAAVVMTLVCDFLMMFTIFDLFEYNPIKWLIFTFTAHVFSMTKTVFTPMSLLFFPDIRERIKTWRPWYSPKPGIDLTLDYKNTTQ